MNGDPAQCKHEHQHSHGGQSSRITLELGDGARSVARARTPARKQQRRQSEIMTRYLVYQTVTNKSNSMFQTPDQCFREPNRP
jgi:hypothetical protein